MPRIIPIKDLKNTTKVSEMCHESDEPVFVTRNGYGDMVFMSMETYESSMKMQQIYRDLEVSEQQVVEGKTKDARLSLAQLREKYGLQA